MRPRRAAACALLAALALAAYANSFTAGFALDNAGLILRDPRVHAFTPQNVDLILHHTYWWPVGESGLYRPVTTFSYLFNYAMLGNADRPFGYHVVNLTLHIANVLLLYTLIVRVLGRDSARARFAAIAGAALWAVHPLGTEAVTNIVGRADLIAGCAVLAAVSLYVTSMETTGWRRILALIGLAGATLIGEFAKESAVVIAAVVLLTGLCVESAPASPLRAKPAASGSRRAMLAAASFAVGTPLVVLWMQRAAILGAAPGAEFPFVDNPIAGASFVTGRLTAVAVMLRYVSLLVWPARLSADYSYAQIPLVDGWRWIAVASAAIAIVVGGLIWSWRRARPVFFFATFAIITFLPASNLLFAAGTIMAERVMYLPAAGLTALAAIGLAAAAARDRWRFAVTLVLIVLVAGLTIRTWVRNIDWRDDVSLWTSAARAAPLSFKAHRGLAEALAESDPAHTDLARVVEESESAVRILDSLPDALNDAQTYRQAAADQLQLGDAIRGPVHEGVPAPPDAMRTFERAESLLQRMIRIVDAAHGPGKTRIAADGYRLLSAANVRLERPEPAVDAASNALALEPESVFSYRQAAAAYLTASRNDDVAIVLMTGSMVTGDASLRDELTDLYQRGLDPLGCAVVRSEGGPSINPRCETVRRHACAAAAEAVRVMQRTGRSDQAARLKQGTDSQLKCESTPG